jgi:hypothetical protein
MRTKLVAALFVGMPGCDRDVECHDVFERHGGEPGDSGSFLPSHERDVQYDVPADRARACVRELRARGFRVVVGEAAVQRYFVEQMAPREDQR